MNLTAATTKELVEELSKREGVKEIVCEDSMYGYLVRITRPGSGHCERHVRGASGCGPARILVVID